MFTVILRITKNAIGILVLVQFRCFTPPSDPQAELVGVGWKTSEFEPILSLHSLNPNEQLIATKNAIGISVSMNLKTSYVNCH